MLGCGDCKRPNAIAGCLPTELGTCGRLTAGLRYRLFAKAPCFQKGVHLCQSEAPVRCFRSGHHKLLIKLLIWPGVVNLESLVPVRRLFVKRNTDLFVKTTVPGIPHSGSLKNLLFTYPLVCFSVPPESNGPRRIPPKAEHGIIAAVE